MSTEKTLSVQSQKRVELWDAINEYAASCCGDTSNRTISPRRMKAVVDVERKVSAVEAAVVERIAAWFDAKPDLMGPYIAADIRKEFGMGPYIAADVRKEFSHE